ncbi:hypothetical protein [Alloalcanivorax venustensis]|uniref:hypothetical protein n=1 Tax=Alloalcanivorax venustensis TaxID=172371 RepID=UPI003511BB00
MKTPTGTVLLSAFLFFSPTLATADTALEQRVAKYASLCDDYERAKTHVECHRPPGSYKHAYEMTGRARERALAQGRKLLRMRRETDEAMDRVGRDRRLYR